MRGKRGQRAGDLHHRHRPAAVVVRAVVDPVAAHRIERSQMIVMRGH